MISDEQLEQSRWSLQGIFTSPLITWLGSGGQDHNGHLVNPISHELLEQSWWNLQGTTNSRCWWPDDLVRFWRSKVKVSSRQHWGTEVHFLVFIFIFVVFTRTTLCYRGNCRHCVSVRLSVHPSVSSRCSTKTAKPRITQITPYVSPGTLVFYCQKSPQNSKGVPPTGATNRGRVGSNRWF